MLHAEPHLIYQNAARIAVQYELGELQKAPDRVSSFTR